MRTKEHLRKFGILLILGIVSSISIFGQTVSCSLQLNVFELDVNKPIQNAENVKAILKETTLKKSLEAASPLLQFQNLTAGNYRVELIKDGVKRREKTIELDCNLADENGLAQTNIYLWDKGIKELPSTKSGDVQFVQGDSMAKPSNGDCLNKPENCSINKGALNLVKPAYPPAARAVNVSGSVNVQATLDEDGNVISAAAVDGHPLLRAAAVKAAKKSKFHPTLLENSPVRVTGIIVYNFTK
jgi:TonB family protein